nr:30S ribosomal protein S6 [Ignavibacteria bacterium]
MSKKHYESYIIIDGNLEEAAIEEEITKNENLLKKHEVEIMNIDRIGRKKLAYQIKKRSNGYYVC